MVGGTSYTLDTTSEQTSDYGCSTNCVYVKTKGDTNIKYCFRPSETMQSVCVDSTGTTPAPYDNPQGKFWVKKDSE